MNNKKYQVFISSTYTDLVEERRKIMDILLMADCIPAGMEAFVATDNEQFEVIKKVIDLCDYYILILGKRYGSISQVTGKSYTEMEYEYAKSKDIPVLVFALDDTVNLDITKCETEEEKVNKLNLFREKALTNRMASIWKNSDDLAGKVAVSIMRAKQEIYRPGWQRATDYDEASLRKQIMDLTESNKKMHNKLDIAERTISELTTSNDLAFEECLYDFNYHYYIAKSNYHGMPQQQKRTDSVKISLPHIFKSISTEMMDVMIGERAIEKIIKNLIKCDHTVYLDDEQIVKRILNQLRNLNLIKSSWDKTNKILYWGLTAKGQKVRDEMILVKNI